MQLIGIVSNLFGHTGQFFWYHLHTHAVGELFCSSQPTATTCLWWSWRLNQCLHSPRQSNGLWYASYLLLVDPTAMPSWLAAAARMIWLCACIRYWPQRSDGTCASVQLLGIVKNLALSYKSPLSLKLFFMKLVPTQFVNRFPEGVTRFTSFNNLEDKYPETRLFKDLWTIRALYLNLSSQVFPIKLFK